MVKKALKVATPSLAQIAKRAGVGTPSMYAYSREGRTPSPKTLRAIARVLRDQAGALITQAAQLDAESNR